MGLFRHLRSHLQPVAIGLVFSFLVWGLLLLMGLPMAEATLVLVLLVFGNAVSVVVDWLLGRDFLSDVEDIASSHGDALALASELRDPALPVGHLVWEAMGNVAREAHVRIGELRVREDDYRDYIETWVHEIKTPLAALDLIAGNIGGVDAYPLRRELDQVGFYVEQALYYARSSAVEKDFVVKVCDLSDVVHEAVRSRASVLIGAGVRPDLSGLEDANRMAMADPKWVAFILGQFIDNAVRYRIADGSRAPRIEFSVRHSSAGDVGERVMLDVWDNGCGIPANDIGRVFDRGFTGENGRTHGRSTGLGLYLVRVMCDKMGVGVVATSLPGSWTCLTLSFPSAVPSQMLREVGPLE